MNSNSPTDLGDLYAHGTAVGFDESGHLVATLYLSGITEGGGPIPDDLLATFTGTLASRLDDLDENVRYALDELARAAGAMDFGLRHAAALVYAERSSEPDRPRALRQFDGAIMGLISAVQHVATAARDGDKTATSAVCELMPE
jgi:hypothetical protein